MMGGTIIAHQENAPIVAIHAGATRYKSYFEFRSSQTKRNFCQCERRGLIWRKVMQINVFYHGFVIGWEWLCGA
jgi:hypothetical protein